VHRALDARVGKKTPLPYDLTTYERIAAKFDTVKGDVLTERKITLNQNFEETSWFAKDAWLRVIFDLSIVSPRKAVILDYKTGKRKMDIDQLELFAVVAMKVHPEVKEVNTGYIWLKEGKIDKQTFRVEEAPRIWGKFLSQVQRLENAHAAQAWPPTPSGLCRAWCPVLSCEFNGRRNGADT
jgi:hypothetical protein